MKRISESSRELFHRGLSYRLCTAPRLIPRGGRAGSAQSEGL
jgi:hypothetical protein